MIITRPFPTTENGILEVYCFHVVHPSACSSVFPSIGNVLFFPKYLKKLKMEIHQILHHFFKFKAQCEIIIPRIGFVLFVSNHGLLREEVKEADWFNVKRTVIQQKKNPYSVSTVKATCEAWARALPARDKTPRVSFPCLFLAISWCSSLNGLAFMRPCSK